MLCQISDKAKDLHVRVQQFVEEDVIPNEHVCAQQVANANTWEPAPMMELKKYA